MGGVGGGQGGRQPAVMRSLLIGQASPCWLAGCRAAPGPHPPRPAPRALTRDAIVVLRLEDKAVEDKVDGLADEGAVHHELA